MCKESIPHSLERFQPIELDKSDVEKINGILYYLGDKEYDIRAENAQETAYGAVFEAQGGTLSRRTF